jgi:ribonucleoside-diphosphate reductase beta chain
MLLEKRLHYAPCEYPEAMEFFQRQQEAHWLWTEINLSGDISDWKQKLNDTERHVIGHILKGFVTAETLVQDYWANKVLRKFKKPEIQMMASTFSSFEAIHTKSYALLNESLNLEDYKSFLQDPTTKAKIDNILDRPERTKHDIAASLAVFSGFTEGVSLFSSFAILLNFSRFNKMKGMGQIIAFSIRDESLHSAAGCWLFRQFVKEYPEVYTDELKKEIYESARLTIKLEDDFIDQAFSLGAIEGLDPNDLKQYIRFRANTKLNDLGLKQNWKNIDKDAVSKITIWFDVLSAGTTMQDFFAGRETNYARGVVNFDECFDD